MQPYKFLSKLADKKAGRKRRTSASPSLHLIEAILISLTHPLAHEPVYDTSHLKVPTGRSLSTEPHEQTSRDKIPTKCGSTTLETANRRCVACLKGQCVGDHCFFSYRVGSQFRSNFWLSSVRSCNRGLLKKCPGRFAMLFSQSEGYRSWERR